MKKVLSPRTLNICKGILDGSIKYWFSDLKADKVYLNNGDKVIAEFSVGKRYEIKDTYTSDHKKDNGKNYVFTVLKGLNCESINIELEEIQNQSYTNQKYAYEICDLIVYDEERTCNRLGLAECDYKKCHYYQDTINYYTNDKNNIVQSPTNDIVDKCNKPTSPLDINEFISISPNNKIKMKLQSPPTQDIYVIKEELK